MEQKSINNVVSHKTGTPTASVTEDENAYHKMAGRINFCLLY